MKGIYFVALLLLISLPYVSCGICKSSSDVNLATLDSSSWVLTHMDGIRANKDTVQTVNTNISKGRISGRATCNSYGAECLVYSDGRIKIGDITPTPMARDRLMYECIFLVSLEEAKTFRMSGSNKLMPHSTHNASGQPSLIFKRK